MVAIRWSELRLDRDDPPDEAATPSVRAAADGAVVVDPIERRWMALRTPAAVEPVPADAEAFPVPIDAAVSFDAEAVSVPYGVGAYVRTPDGAARRSMEGGGTATLPAADHLVELSGPVKTYLRTDAPVTVEVTHEQTTVSFDGETSVVVGVRSYHSRPAATVTTTDDPVDVMRAVSTFGSALKTTSPERSFPTLRGHPPLVTVGEEFAAPDGVDPPDTGVTVEVPATTAAAAVAAPLAYYLGATVETGESPRLVADGVEHRLDGDGFETGVASALQHAFLLDCVVRTEGWYRVPVAERAVVEPHIDRDIADLYDAPIAERLDAALALPSDVVADAISNWPLAAYVTGDAATVTALPRLADELAVVRAAPDGDRVDVPDAVPVDVTGFARATRGGHLPRPRVDPPQVDALAQVWVGDGTPLAGGKLLPAALDNRLDRDPSDDLAVTVVCTDDAMMDECDSGLYTGRDDVPLDVTLHSDPTVDGLRDVLAEGAAFLHYVGHVEPDGLVCADGTLDAAGLDTVGVETFLLNGCRSYAQGVSLVEAGAIGGIVTVSDVANDHATALGRTVARLLDVGFPLRFALDVADDGSGRYVSVGDAGIAVAQCDGGVPNVVHVESRDDDARVRIQPYPTPPVGVGSLFRPYADGIETGVLVGGSSAEVTLPPDALRELLAMEELPAIVDGDRTWTSAVDVDALF